eukprot:11160755-Lingulodinium_polyedra.AAC.1
MDSPAPGRHSECPERLDWRSTGSVMRQRSISAAIWQYSSSGSSGLCRVATPQQEQSNVVEPCASP